MSWSTHQALILDVIAGACVHLYCRKHEPENYYALSSVLLTVPLLPASLLFLSSPSHTPLLHSLLLSFSVFFTSLLCSMTLYRVSPLHPLAGYPGPVIWKVSKFAAAWYGAKGKYHVKLKALHERYGPIVRIGPNELSITQKDLIPFILGSKGMPKGPLWEGRRILPSANFNINNHMIGVRDLKRHAELRKPWNKAFGTGPLKDYEEILVSRAALMASRLEELCEASKSKAESQPEKSSEKGTADVDLTQWASFFAFDFMGDIAFTADFRLLKDGDVNGFVKNMEAAQRLPTIVQHVPWLAKITRATPFISTNLRKFGAFALEQAKNRASRTMVKKDLFFHKIQAMDPSLAASPLPIIVAGAVLTILAGSDTTSSALATTFYSLLRHPECYKQLQREIDEVCADGCGDPLPTPDRLAQLPYLNAVINESMRLYPPVPTSIQRAPKIGSGGKILGSSMFLPEGTNVQVPPYVLHRDPRYFYPNPDGFWPERWILSATSSSASTSTSHKDPDRSHPSSEAEVSSASSDTESDSSSTSASRFKSTSTGTPIVHERCAFIPFSVGPANCAGKPLALMELRYVISLLIRKFDIEFQEGFDVEGWEESLTDRLTMFRGPLPVRLRRRGMVS